MASISREASGCRRVQFSVDGARKTLRLGNVPARVAETFRAHIEHMISCRTIGAAPPNDTSQWLRGLSDEAYARLAAVGVVAPRSTANVGLGKFLRGCLADRPDVKVSTLAAMQSCARSIVEDIGEHTALRDVTPASADAYRAHMVEAGLARATIGKRIRYARHFFSIAARRKLIDENPFSHIPCAVTGNAARRVFVTAEAVLRVMEEMPDVQWKLLLALGRWGGLRIPSEAVSLRWVDVDFAGKRFVIRSPKTAHHTDGGVRIVPMFTELQPLFQQAFDQAEPGAEYVVPRCRSGAVNLRTQLCRFITRAGVKPWPKLWQNLRASRATELVDQFPSHVCAAWLGHTERIADAFYRQVTDSHFDRATQITTQQAAETVRKRQNTKNTEENIIPAIAVSCGPLLENSIDSQWAIQDSNL